MLLIIIISLLSELASATTILEVGACPNVTSVPDLELEKLAGEWTHILHFPSEDEPFASCTHSSYTFKDSHLEVLTSGKDATGSDVTRSGVLGQLDLTSEGLQLDMDGMPPLNVMVAYTDYTSMACLYSCTSFPGLRVDWAWALTRSRHPRPRVVTRCRAKLRRLGVNAAKFVRISQSDEQCLGAR